MVCTCEGHRSARSNAALILAGLSLLLTLSGAAYAAGTGLVLGKANQAKTTTTLLSQRDEPLSVLSRDGSAPFKVNSSELVTGLNSDKLDGLDAGAFLRSDQAPPDLSGWVVMVAGSSCPAGSEQVGIAGRYGAEDQSQAGFGSYLYRVEYSAALGSYRLARDRAPLIMTACRVN